MVEKMTPDQAYKAMYQFLDDYYRRTKSDDVGSLLSSMSLLGDGRPADAAIVQDWMGAVTKAVSSNVDALLRLTK